MLSLTSCVLVACLLVVHGQTPRLTIRMNSLTLPCHVNGSKDVRAVKWTRANMNGVYVLLYRDDQLDPENQQPSFAKRVDLKDRRMVQGSVSLVINNMTQDDMGVYDCNVFDGTLLSWQKICSLNSTQVYMKGSCVIRLEVPFSSYQTTKL